MKEIIKKILFYDKIYDFIKTSFVYQAWKRLMGNIANTFYGYPSKDFFVIGVTGTNGKTTTVNLIHKMLNDKVGPTVMVSTAVIKIGDKEIINEKKMTSLDIFDLQSILSTAKSKGCKIAVLEVSSHGMDQYRFEGVDFDFAILTNLTHDHLDYHGNFNNYINAKKKLFKYVLRNNKSNKYAVFPADDKIGRTWSDDMAFDKKITFGVNNSAILRAENIVEEIDSTSFDIIYLGKKFHMKTFLPGTYNVYNILSALSVAVHIGLDMEQAVASLSGFKGVSGRMEAVKLNGVNYFIDFAHSPDALDKTLAFLNTIKKDKKLIVVFGAPGNRDKLKRPDMGSIAYSYADVLIATDDDPDTENRIQILNQLTEKIRDLNTPNKELYIIPERELAIKFATEQAKEGDFVMFAGKGHETVQLTNFGRKKWNDKDILENLINTSTKVEG
ncbi:UDP-N-acetylmuramoyl-L-alanyl-D-glutamate--2,6-diaminopimelate ligase [Candidatus Gracilibacteria bacterium]|nr:UDP-N-acetylmuramoyl-L-alanyl-D-glutamate--2,6-diaminopimelate ligase [Candidatus Gracilibacteria bacterium]